MKRINPEEITKNLSEEQLEILAEMLGETPVSKEWILCHKQLTDEQIAQVHDKRGELRDRKEQERINFMSKEEKEKEDEKRRLWFENADPHDFYGNMGQPTGVYDYKERYGVWPPGLDDTIAPLNFSTELNPEQIKKIANLYLKYRENVQWEEVYLELQKRQIDLSIIFNNVIKMNNGVFPLDISVEEFKNKYGVFPPDYYENGI